MTKMTITLKNPTRQPANYSLTLDCVCTALPATTDIRIKTVYAESYPHRAAMIAETVSYPPTITLSAREIRKGLPDAVAKAPEIAAAVAAGQLMVIPEVNPVYQRPAQGQDASVAVSDQPSEGAAAGGAPKPHRGPATKSR